MPSRTSSAGARRVASAQLLTELGRRGGHHPQGGRRPGHEYACILDAVEIEMSHAAREAIRHRPSDLERQAGLADTARAEERDQSDAGAHQQLADLGALAGASNRLVGRRRQRCGEGTAGTIGQEIGIVREDHALQAAQLRSRLDAQLLHQQRAAGAHRLRAPPPADRRDTARPSAAPAAARAADARRPGPAAHRRDPHRPHRPAPPPAAPSSASSRRSWRRAISTWANSSKR